MRTPLNVRFEKELKRAKEKGVPQEHLDKIRYGDMIGIVVATSAWMNSPERLEKIDKERRTPAHNSLLKFLKWAIDNDYLRWTGNLRQQRDMVKRGDPVANFNWLIDLMEEYVRNGKYKPRNMRRKKAPWG